MGDNNLDNLRRHLDARLDRIEAGQEKQSDKLDNHLGRLATVEADQVWIKGHAKVLLTLIISAIGTLAGIVMQMLLGK